MTREQWKDWLGGIGILAIVGSLIFVALEIKTNGPGGSRVPRSVTILLAAQ